MVLCLCVCLELITSCLFWFTACRRDENTSTFPEGGDLCRGYGSIEIPALSADYDGVPYFNLLPATAEQRRMLPLLNGRVRNFTKMKIYKPLTHTRQAVCQLNFNKIGTTVGALRSQWTSYENMVVAEQQLHTLFSKVQEKLVLQGQSQPTQSINVCDSDSALTD